MECKLFFGKFLGDYGKFEVSGVHGCLGVQLCFSGMVRSCLLPSWYFWFF
jgi:hypothetical protein